MRRHRYWGLIVSLLAAPACLKKKPLSEPVHDFGALVGDAPKPYMWLRTTPEEFQKWADGGEKTYPRGHPRVARLQLWVDAMDDEVRKTVPNLSAPKPQILLYQDPTINAFVPSVPVCLDATVSNTAPSGFIDDVSLFVDAIETMRFRRTKVTECLNPAHDQDVIRPLLEHGLGIKDSCYSIAEDKAKKTTAVILNLQDDSCTPEQVRKQLASLRAARQLVYRAIPNIIGVHDKLFDLEEEEVVSILAHELGHYYRFHALAREGSYGYFYKLDEKHNIGSKPQPLPADDPIVQLGKETLKKSDQFLGIAPVTQQKYNSLIFASLLNKSSFLVFACEKDEACATPCSALDKHMSLGADKKREMLAGFPLSGELPNTSTAQRYYQDYETKADACFRKLRITESLYPPLWQYLSTFPVEGLAAGLDVESYKTFADLILAINLQLPTRIAKQNEAVSEVLKKANAARVGVYTDEQEADDIGLELSHRVGIATKFYVGSFLSALKSFQLQQEGRLQPPGVLGYAACQAALAKGFPDFVPIGTYFDPHHSTCYRVYNSYREAMAHAQELATLPPYEGITPDKTLWESLRKTGL